MKELGNIYEVDFREAEPRPVYGAGLTDSFRTNVLADSISGAVEKVTTTHAGVTISGVKCVLEKIQG